MASDCRYYLRGAVRWALNGITALLLAITAALLMDFLNVASRYGDIARHPYFDNGNARMAPFIAVCLGEIAACVGLLVALRVIWKPAFGPQVVLREQSFSGIRVRRKSAISGVCFLTGIHCLGRLIDLGEIRYDDVGSVSESRILGLRFKRFSSRRDSGVSINIPYAISNAQECFDLLNQRIAKSG